jgi:hypothetical protein
LDDRERPREPPLLRHDAGPDDLGFVDAEMQKTGGRYAMFRTQAPRHPAATCRPNCRLEPWPGTPVGLHLGDTDDPHRGPVRLRIVLDKDVKVGESNSVDEDRRREEGCDMSKREWGPNWSVWVGGRVQCTYCGLDAVQLGGRWDLFCTEHLAPKGKGGPDTLLNKVLSCAGCNDRKGQKFDPRQDGEYLELTEQNKPRLIERAKRYIEERRRQYDKDFLQMLTECGRREEFNSPSVRG